MKATSSSSHVQVSEARNIHDALGPAPEECDDPEAEYERQDALLADPIFRYLWGRPVGYYVRVSGRSDDGRPCEEWQGVEGLVHGDWILAGEGYATRDAARVAVARLMARELSVLGECVSEYAVIDGRALA